MIPEEYLGYLRASYRRDPRTPRPFLQLVHHARQQGLTLISSDRPDLVEVLSAALVRVAETKRRRRGGTSPAVA